jgi:hypothetical protein
MPPRGRDGAPARPRVSPHYRNAELLERAVNGGVF